MAAPLGLLKDLRTTALGAVAADDEQDVDLAPDQVIDGHADIDRAT